MVMRLRHRAGLYSSSLCGVDEHLSSFNIIAHVIPFECSMYCSQRACLFTVVDTVFIAYHCLFIVGFVH